MDVISKQKGPDWSLPEGGGAKAGFPYVIPLWVVFIGAGNFKLLRAAQNFRSLILTFTLV